VWANSLPFAIASKQCKKKIRTKIMAVSSVANEQKVTPRDKAMDLSLLTS